MADGNEYNVVLLKEAGQPVEPVYPAEGTPTISGPTGIFSDARRIRTPRGCSRPGCIRRETQQFFIDFTAQYSAHPQVTAKPGRRKISDIKLMKEDPAGGREDGEEIKTRYAKLFPGLTLLRPGAAVIPGRLATPRRSASVDDSGIALRSCARHDEICKQHDRLTTTSHHCQHRPSPNPASTGPSRCCGCLRPCLVVLIVLPLSWLAVYSVTDKAGHLTLQNFVTLFTDPDFLDPLLDHRDHRDHLGRRSAAWWPRRWAGWWRAPTCRGGRPSARW